MVRRKVLMRGYTYVVRSTSRLVDAMSINGVVLKAKIIYFCNFI